MKKISILLLTLLSAITISFAGMGGDHNFSIADNYSYQELSANEIEGILVMREEEKLARDVYLELYDTWGEKIFQNIANSEQKHMDQMLNLINKYGLEDPVLNDERGVFTNPDLSNLYTQLVSSGKESLESALKVGATIEDLDISDLEKYISESDNDDIRAVYQNLMKGSRNHLRSFTSQLSNLGVNYTPQYISLEEYNNIITSDFERGIRYGPNGEIVMNMSMQGQMQGMGQGMNGNAQGQMQGRGQGMNGNAQGQINNVENNVQDNAQEESFTMKVQNMFKNMFGKLFSWFN